MKDWLRGVALKYLVERFKEPSSWVGVLLGSSWVAGNLRVDQVDALSALIVPAVAFVLTFLPNRIGGTRPDAKLDENG